MMEVRVVVSSDRYDSLNRESALHMERKLGTWDVLFTLGRQVATKPGIRVSIVHGDKSQKTYPIDMAPAMSSAKPPRITTLLSPNPDRPAVRAKGTVNPSERPMIASEINLASTLKPLPVDAVSALSLIHI